MLYYSDFSAVDLHPWDGKTDGGYQIEDPGIYSDLLQDESGDIYYKRLDGSGKVSVWCSKSRLSAHAVNSVRL